ncbi:MAG: GNAT family N-acetyltransferase [Gammaproteobacteria bacterium]
MEVKQIDGITEISCTEWNELAGIDYPFLRHEFLSALETSGSVCRQTGWQPKHIIVYEQDKAAALMPLYFKLHSRGEYVFDQQWALAYRQQGLSYYPKWLTSIPFTPCQGKRIAVRNGSDRNRLTTALIDFVKELSKTQGISSWHCLFPEPESAHQLEAAGLSLRLGVQYQWHNRGFRDFDDYLDGFTSSKRKQVRRERRRVAEQHIRFECVPGTSISDMQWEIFVEFYRMTYFKHGMEPYLNLEFFTRLAETMPEQLLLVLAFKHDKPAGAALSLVGNDTLYGRYWGCYEEYHSLHFEACYYQGLDYCIDRGLKRFDSGAQGEHKIARGFEPVLTYSAHWLQEPAMARAVDLFLRREQEAVKRYHCEAAAFLPFKCSN